MAAKKQTAKRTSKVPADETREQKFLRIANMRMPRILKQIGLIGNLASYPHSDDNAEKITSALYAAVQGVEQRFAKTAKEAPSFKL